MAGDFLLLMKPELKIVVLWNKITILYTIEILKKMLMMKAKVFIKA